MDQSVFAQFESAGLDPTFDDHMPILGFATRETGEVHPITDTICVVNGEKSADITARSIPELFAGTRKAPNLESDIPDHYLKFLAVIERTAVDYCHISRVIERDVEFERLYSLLARRPAGRDANPLFSYLQAAARIYMSLNDVSAAEFDAVVRRLARAARRRADGPASRNYIQNVMEYL